MKYSRLFEISLAGVALGLAVPEVASATAPTDNATISGYVLASPPKDIVAAVTFKVPSVTGTSEISGA
jgi:hypothetical protein